MRAWLRCLAAMAVLASAGACEAQVAAGIAATEPYPSRPVRIIVPFGAGGPGDLFARLIVQQLGENLGKAFYIENHPGAAGNIGTALAARAPADGYTLVVVSSTFMINATLYPKLPYDPIKDFDPITIADDAQRGHGQSVGAGEHRRRARRADPCRQIYQLRHGRNRHAVASVGRALSARPQAGPGGNPLQRRRPGGGFRDRRPYAGVVFGARARRGADQGRIAARARGHQRGALPRAPRRPDPERGRLSE